MSQDEQTTQPVASEEVEQTETLESSDQEQSLPGPIP